MRDTSDDSRLFQAYDAVLSVPPSERAAFIRSTFGADPTLARHLERLAARGATAEGLFREPVEALLQPVLADLEALEEADAQHTRRAGELWSDLYEPVRTLGRGGMGRTLLARERSSGRLVCIKELFTHVDRRVLEQENRALSKLSHPNVVRLLRLDAEAALPFLVMEYVDGTNVTEYMRHVTSPKEAEIAAVIRPIADGIAALHAHNIIHRDLKPENILMSKRGHRMEPVIIDLGLAVIDQFDYENRLTAAGPMIIGTPAYMAPEQFFGEVLTPACDVYALGEIIFELATGRPAFSGAMSEVFEAKSGAKSGLTVPDTWWRRRWPVLGRLVRECTRPHPSVRPSAAAVVATLNRVLHTR